MVRYFLIGLFILVGPVRAMARAHSGIPDHRPSDNRWCFDFTHTLPSDLIKRVDDEGYSVRKNFDVDFVVMIIPSLRGHKISPLTAELFTKWKIGKSTRGKKGILILIAQQEQQIKIEVGYDLEAVYTDLYIGQVEREFLKEFLEQADWDRGLLATLENFLERLYRKNMVGEVRAVTSPDDDDEYYSQGAGAKTTFTFAGALDKPLPQTTPERRKYFCPQPSPQKAFERYMELLALNLADKTLDIYSDQSKIFYSHWLTSSGQRRAEYDAARGKQYVVRRQGKYAVVMAPFNTSINDFICQCPYFFVLTEAGWHIDINTMSRTLIMGGPTWHFLSLAHPYMFAFKDYILRTNRYYPNQGQKAFLGITYSLFDRGPGPFKITPERDSPAKEAGILDGDILISINGVEIMEAYQDWEMMKHFRPGDRVTVLVKRKGINKRMAITLRAPESYLDEFPYVRNTGDPWTGFYFAYSQPYERKIEDVQLSVIDVAADSPAEKAGFRPGDLIYTVPGSRDRHVGFRDYKNMLQRARPGQKVNFKVLRNLKKRLSLEVEIEAYAQGKQGI